MQTLKEICAAIITSPLPPEALSPHVLMLGKALSEARSAETENGVQIDEPRATQNGLAISPLRAQMCLAEHRRTVEFARGVHRAVLDLKAGLPDRPVRVLYAGCGPFATLLIPSMALLEADDLQVSVIDMYAESLASVREILEAHGLSDRIGQTIHGDAGSYRIDPDSPPDLIVMEILESGLDKEPQVWVSRHLLAQCPEAVLIPEDITLSVTLINIAQEFAFDGSPLKRDRIDLGDVFSLNKAHIAQWPGGAVAQLPAATLNVPEYDGAVYTPMLRTRIATYGGHRLDDYDTGLTVPKAHACLDAVRPGGVARFAYRTGAQPGLICEAL